MATQNLGRVKMVWKGDYSSSTAYVVDDAVFYEGSSYICKQNATAKIPTNTNYWDKMASKGNSGAVPAIGMSATVDGTSSATPSVTVTEGGTALQPTFELAFSGLKGAKGDKGDKGDSTTANEDNIIANTKLIKDTVGWSGKNKLIFPYANWDSSLFQATITTNKDGTLVINGTQTAQGDLAFHFRMPLSSDPYPLYLPIGRYKFTVGTDMAVYVGTTYNSAYKAIATASNTGTVTFEITENTQSDYKLSDGSVLVAPYVTVSPQTYSNRKLYPMIYSADILDPTYEPYFGSTAFPRSEQAVLGAKNRLRNTATSTTSHGVEFVVSADKSVTIKSGGEADSDIYFPIFPQSADPEIPQGNYIISGGFTPPQDLSIKFYLNERNANNTQWGNQWADTTGNGVIYNRSNDYHYAYFIFIRSGTSITSDITVRPMVRIATDPDDTYVPYAMTNKELTEKVFEKGILDASNDLDDIKTTGIYGVGSAPTNSPEGLQYYTLIVGKYQGDGQFTQMAIKTGTIYVRRFFYDSGTATYHWDNWYKFTGTVVS